MEFKLSTLDQLEKYTRKGDSLRVANVINSLRLSKIPREYSAQLSQICFRNGLYLESLKILNKIIYGETSLLSPPEPNELISYATSLVSLNMPKEARKVLKGVNKLENPEALLIESFSHFGDWNYKKTLPILKKFISNPRISHYRSLVGKLNLAAAYIDVSQFNEAKELLYEMLSHTQKNNFSLLQANSLELLGQIEIQDKNYEKALKYLRLAKKVFPETNSIYYFFVKKWENICLLLQNPNNASILKSCEGLKQQALSWRSWESRRDIDLYISYATKNPYLLQKILIGTPNIHYHNKIERLFDKKIEKQKLFSLSAHDIDPLQSKRIVEYQNFHQELRSSQYQQKLFSLITRDFYKPCNIGSLFENLYPKEYFNPLSSEKRLLNHVYRLNDNSTNNFFQLKKDKMDFIFLLNKNTELVFQIVNHRDRYSPSLKERIKKIGRKPFSSDELAKNLDCSQRKAQMLIKTMVIENFLFKLNLGNKTKYVMSCYKKEFSLNGNNI